MRRDVINVVAGDSAKDINLVDIRGHEHQYGTLFQLDRLSTGAQLYHQTDGPLMRVDPARVRYPLDAPLKLSAGE